MLCPCHEFDTSHTLSMGRRGGYIIILRDTPLFEQFAQFMVDNPDDYRSSPRQEDEESKALALKVYYDEKYGETPWIFRKIGETLSQFFGSSRDE